MKLGARGTQGAFRFGGEFVARSNQAKARIERAQIACPIILPLMQMSKRNLLAYLEDEDRTRLKVCGNSALEICNSLLKTHTISFDSSQPTLISSRLTCPENAANLSLAMSQNFEEVALGNVFCGFDGRPNLNVIELTSRITSLWKVTALEYWKSVNDLPELEVFSTRIRLECPQRDLFAGTVLHRHLQTMVEAANEACKNLALRRAHEEIEF